MVNKYMDFVKPVMLATFFLIYGIMGCLSRAFPFRLGSLGLTL